MVFKRPFPYVGVSGIVDKVQQKQLISCFSNLNFPDSRNLLLGVKAVHKTQFLDVPNKYGSQWYPVGDTIKNSVEPWVGHNILPVTQCYLDADYVDDKSYRDLFMKKLFNRCDSWLQGVQFDLLPFVERPDIVSWLQDLKNDKKLPILLQCYKGVMDSVGEDNIVDCLESLVGVADYVLFDASHGTGQRLNVDVLGGFIEKCYSSSKLETMNFGVAGGLSFDSLEDIRSLVSCFPLLSWDAEGALHPVDQDGKRPLDIKKTVDYLVKSAELMLV